MSRSKLVILALGIACSGAAAGSLNVTVKDSRGTPIRDAVVYAKSAGTVPRATKEAIIDQQNKQFIPYVTAVQVGTSIVFPNRDDIRHHVYSLSPAKKFELPLYAGVPAQPVLFDKEGFVTLGCNIHDWMIAYVAVLGTPYFQVSGADGHVALKELPSGHYSVAVWHPLLKGSPEQSAQAADVSGGGNKDLVFQLDLKADFRAKRAPGLTSGGYR